MRKKGTVYDCHWGKTSGEVWVAFSKTLKVVWNLSRTLGLGLIVSTIAAVILIWAPLIKEEVSFRIGHKRISEQESSGFGPLVEKAEAEMTEEVLEEAKELGAPNADFSIVIPKIGAVSQVLANIDPTDEPGYLAALEAGVAHARGTAFPGQRRGTIYLFAHSTDAPSNIARFNAVFYLLRKLDKGDRIIVFFANKKYIYKVSEKVIANADDVSYLTHPRDEETLILQTCYPPGTTLKRLLVIAKPS